MNGAFQKKPLIRNDNGPCYIAEALSDRIPKDSRPSYHVLDFGAGGGLLAYKLQLKGFTKIDALVVTPTVPAHLYADKIYSEIHRSCSGIDQLNIKDDTYDGVAAFELFDYSHVPCTVLAEMVRVVKQGGIITFIIRKATDENTQRQSNHNKQIQHVESFIKKLQVAQAWELVSKEVKTDCIGGDSGTLYMFKVVKPGTVIIV